MSPIQPIRSRYQGPATKCHPGPIPSPTSRASLSEKPINTAVNNNTSYSPPQVHDVKPASQLSNAKNKSTPHRRFIKHDKYKQLQEQSIINTRTVINLSSQPLTPTQTQLLSKNLNFCPTPSAINPIEQ